MHFEGDMHHVDMQFAFSMIHINVISLITVCASSHKPCLGNYRTSVALARQIFFFHILVTESLIHMCVQKYTAVFRDLFESYSQCLLFQHNVLAPTYYVPLHLIFFLLNFCFFYMYFLLVTCSR